MKYILFKGFIGGLVLAAGSLLLTCGRPSEPMPDPDFRAVTLLLDIMDTAAAHNPGNEAWVPTLDTLRGGAREKLLDSLSATNRTDPVLGAMIDSLLSLPAYRVYYSRFTNVGPDDHRTMLLRLPYGWVSSPADVSRTLFDISRQAGRIRAMVSACRDRLDLDKAARIAQAWLPAGEYSLPPVYFIMDGNGDAFAVREGIVFDLYSVLLRQQLGAGAAVFDSAAGDVLNGVMAHELNHIFAAPFFEPAGSDQMDWRSRFRARVTRTITSEGIAMLCDPLTGFRRDIREDTAVVAFWIAELTRTFRELDNDSLTEDQAREWYRSTFHERARELLVRHFSSEYSGDELLRVVNLHQVDRPSMVYTLGWWMLNRISRDRTDHDAVYALLRDPSQVYRMYDEAVSGAPDSLLAIALE